MRIEGSIRANMLAAIASARRWRGRPVHQDTIDHWRRLLDYGRRCSSQPGEVLGDVVAELEAELGQIRLARKARPAPRTVS
jgi:hypothetical protein